MKTVEKIKKIKVGFATWFKGFFKKKNERVELGVFTHDGKHMPEDALAKAERILEASLEKAK